MSSSEFDDYELISVRCIQCNRVLARKAWIDGIRDMRSKGISLCDALDKFGILSFCCRAQFLNPDVIQNIPPSHQPEGLQAKSVNKIGVDSKGNPCYVRKYAGKSRLIYATPNRKPFSIGGPYSKDCELSYQSAKRGPHDISSYRPYDSKSVSLKSSAPMKALTGDKVDDSNIADDDDSLSIDSLKLTDSFSSSKWIDTMAAPIDMDD